MHLPTLNSLNNMVKRSNFAFISWMSKNQFACAGIGWQRFLRSIFIFPNVIYIWHIWERPLHSLSRLINPQHGTHLNRAIPLEDRWIMYSTSTIVKFMVPLSNVLLQLSHHCFLSWFLLNVSAETLASIYAISCYLKPEVEFLKISIVNQVLENLRRWWFPITQEY